MAGSVSRRSAQVEAALALLREGKVTNPTAAAREAGAPRTTVRDRWRDEQTPQVEAPGKAEHPDGSATLASDPAAPGTATPEGLLRQHGLEPEDWEIVRVRGNAWGDENGPKAQLRVDAVPKAGILSPVDPDEYEPLPAPTAPEFGDRSVVYVTDHHAPHHDPTMHALVCQYLSSETPDLIVVGGDLGDYATVSRHRDTLGFAQSVNECNQGAYTILRDYREVSPHSRVVLLPGNHEARLDHYLADRAPEVLDVVPAFEETPAYSLERLLRLDHLGVEAVGGDWERAKFAISDTLTARHGYTTSEGLAQKMLSKHSRSQIQGHSHRLRFVYRTKHDPVDVRVSIEAGCACLIEQGLGYAAEPDWQQGFVAGWVWADGDFALAPYPYIDGRLLCPDGRRFTA